MSPDAFRITELRLRNFRAFERALLAIDPLTVLVGRNGAGKSSLMDAFALLREALRDSLDNALERRGGFEQVHHHRAPRDEVALALAMTNGELDANYGMVFGLNEAGALEIREERLRTRPRSSAKASSNPHSFDRRLGFVESDEFRAMPPVEDDRVRPRVERDSLLLPLVANMRPEWRAVADAIAQCATHHLSPQAMRATTEIGDRTRLLPDGRNFGDVLKQLSKQPDGLRPVEDYLSSILPGLQSLRADAYQGQRKVSFMQAQGQGSSAIFDQSQMSDGTLRALGLLLALFQQPAPSLCFLDEIEDTLHPHAIAVLMEAIHEASSREDHAMPVVITTHHPDLLSNPLVNGESLRIVQWQDGVSQIHRPSADTLAMLKPPEDVGRLLRANALWPADAPELPPEDFFGFR